MQNFNAHDFVEAWRSGRDLKSEVEAGKTDEEKLMKEMEATVNSQEGFRPSEEQWEEIKKALAEMINPPAKEEEPKVEEAPKEGGEQ